MGRPDIAHAVSYLSQLNSTYQAQHWKAAKRVLRYLKLTCSYGITYPSNSDGKLVGFVDADWGVCIIDRRSYTGYCFLLNEGCITWESRKQQTTALSTVEAEYMGLAEAAKETIYLRNLLGEVGLPCTEAINWVMTIRELNS